MPENLDALRGECRRISTVVDELPEAAFGGPTRCGAWTVKELVAHVYGEVDETNTGLAEFPPAIVDADAVSYWRRYDPAAGGPDIADRAVELAASFESGSALATAWDEMWRRAVARAILMDGSRPIVTWGPVLTLNEYLRTRVLEVTVHGLDLAAALGRPAWATPVGLAVTTDILRTLLGITPPVDLGWDDVTFIEVGTGRRAPTSRERDVLGGLSVRFPLLA